jgi:transcription initiation factor TFIIIB Brf1 subunit/transcription initiation factor TFIIB
LLKNELASQGAVVKKAHIFREAKERGLLQGRPISGVVAVASLYIGVEK